MGTAPPLADRPVGSFDRVDDPVIFGSQEDVSRMAKQPRSLAGRGVAITGGARGIGRATAAALAREGGRVAIGDLDADLARRTAEEIGPAASAFALDVTDRASFEAFIGGVEAQLGPVDVLVNNAGIMPLGPFVEEDDLTARRLVD